VGLPSLTLAALDPVPDRQAAMKDVGQQMKDVPQLAATLMPLAKTLMERSPPSGAAGLFPAGSGADPKTPAAPSIWENNADFTKRLTDWRRWPPPRK
jgi:cytochrome c556